MWKEMFKEIILIRGYDYFQNNNVVEIEIFDDHVVSKVIGTKLYHVIINYNLGVVTNLSCDCPYANLGHNCKHMAAVLFYLEEGKFLDLENDLSIFQLANMLQSVDDNKLKFFLFNNLLQNNKLLVSFLNYYKNGTHHIVENFIFNFKQEIDYFDYKNEDITLLRNYLFVIFDIFLLFDLEAEALDFNQKAFTIATEKLEYEILIAITEVVLENYLNMINLNNDTKKVILKQLKNILTLEFSDSLKFLILKFINDNFKEIEFESEKASILKH